MGERVFKLILLVANCQSAGRRGKMSLSTTVTNNHLHGIDRGFKQVEIRVSRQGK